MCPAFAVRKSAASDPERAYVLGMSQYAVFETAIGWAGVAWAESRLIGAYLPQSNPAIVRKGFTRKFPGASQAAPPPAIASVVDRIVALMLGEKVDLSDAPLDVARAPEFNAKVYEIRAESRPDRLLPMARSPSSWATGFSRNRWAQRSARIRGPS
jgi:hypothetical protein